jgi:CheY-like chemotaxis protein
MKNWIVEVADDGTVALSILSNENSIKFDCMILDLRMNFMDGDILLKELYNKGLKPPKTILLSAYTDGLNLDKLKSLGIIEIIKKPCDPQIIEESLSKLILNNNLTL